MTALMSNTSTGRALMIRPAPSIFFATGADAVGRAEQERPAGADRKSTRLTSRPTHDVLLIFYCENAEPGGGFLRNPKWVKPPRRGSCLKKLPDGPQNNPHPRGAPQAPPPPNIFLQKGGSGGGGGEKRAPCRC